MVYLLGHIDYKQDLGFLTELSDIEDETSLNKNKSNLKSLLPSSRAKPTSSSSSSLKPIYYNPKRSSDSFKLIKTNNDDSTLEGTSQLATQQQHHSPPPPLPDGPPPIKLVSNSNVFRNNLIKNFLNLFLNRRPPIEQLKNKGIIQG